MLWFLIGRTGVGKWTSVGLWWLLVPGSVNGALWAWQLYRLQWNKNVLLFLWHSLSNAVWWRSRCYWWTIKMWKIFITTNMTELLENRYYLLLSLLAEGEKPGIQTNIRSCRGIWERETKNVCNRGLRKWIKVFHLFRSSFKSPIGGIAIRFFWDSFGLSRDINIWITICLLSKYGTLFPLKKLYLHLALWHFIYEQQNLHENWNKKYRLWCDDSARVSYLLPVFPQWICPFCITGGRVFAYWWIGPRQEGRSFWSHGAIRDSRYGGYGLKFRTHIPWCQKRKWKIFEVNHIKKFVQKMP